MGALDNAKRERFCQEYLIDRNAGRAYERAGYAARGNAAEVSAHRLLSDAKVRDRVAELEGERAERVRFTADEVLAELRTLGLSNVEHYVLDDDGHLALAEGAPPEAIRAVSSVKRRVRTVTTTRGGEERTERTVDVEFKLWDKPAALRMGGQHNGMFVERHEHTVAEPIRVVDFNPPEPGGPSGGGADAD